MISFIAMLVAIFAPIVSIVKSINERITPFRAVLHGLLTGIVGALVVMVIGQFMGMNVFDELFVAVDEVIKKMTENPEMVAMLGDAAAVDEFAQTMTYVYETSIKLLPSALCIVALIASYLEYIVLSKVLRPGGIAPIPMTKMQEFDLPRRLITLWCLVYIVMLILSQSEAFADSIILMNINALFDFAFCLQGISVIFMFCHTRKIPRAIPGVLMVLVLVFGLLKGVVMLLGFVDLLFGLKYRMKQRI